MSQSNSVRATYRSVKDSSPTGSPQASNNHVDAATQAKESTQRVETYLDDNTTSHIQQREDDTQEISRTRVAAMKALLDSFDVSLPLYVVDSPDD